MAKFNGKMLSLMMILVWLKRNFSYLVFCLQYSVCWEEILAIFFNNYFLVGILLSNWRNLKSA